MHGRFYPGTVITVSGIQPLSGAYQKGGNGIFSPYCSVSQAGTTDENQAPVPIRPVNIPIHNAAGRVIEYREQLPVIPAYPLTVHRSHGLSLNKVTVDFSQTFVERWSPCGTVYVAVSRCHSMSDLWMKRS